MFLHAIGSGIATAAVMALAGAFSRTLGGLA
jgi:hypothetical protein